jgi:peptidoglycan/xylan/chitin deacetylase (PgdA/CDA1 family)
VRLALKIDVDTLRGTVEGVPRLIDALREARAGATFLFSVGPDHTGRAIRRAFRPGFLSKVKRTSVVSHYGLRTLLYGTLLPGPHIGRRAGGVMRLVREAGFEVGVHCHDHVRWQDQVARRDEAWTAREMERAVSDFQAVFGAAPRVHGAAGWQMNAAAFALEDRLGLDYASDTRGERPFRPVVADRPLRCPQLPTTLPTLDELIGVDGTDERGVADVLLARTAAAPARDHVFTLHAELEGMALLPVLTRLLAGWRSQGYELVAMERLWRSLDPASLPHCAVEVGEVPGRSGTLAVQGAVVGEDVAARGNA